MNGKEILVALHRAVVMLGANDRTYYDPEEGGGNLEDLDRDENTSKPVRTWEPSQGWGEYLKDRRKIKNPDELTTDQKTLHFIHDIVAGFADEAADAIIATAQHIKKGYNFSDSDFAVIMEEHGIDDQAEQVFIYIKIHCGCKLLKKNRQAIINFINGT
jgi:hypothetical protein